MNKRAEYLCRLGQNRITSGICCLTCCNPLWKLVPKSQWRWGDAGSRSEALGGNLSWGPQRSESHPRALCWQLHGGASSRLFRTCCTSDPWSAGAAASLASSSSSFSAKEFSLGQKTLAQVRPVRHCGIWMPVRSEIYFLMGSSWGRRGWAHL